MIRQQEQPSDLQRQIANLRKRYKSGVHVSVFPDNTIIPWRCLTLKEVFHYSQLANRGYRYTESLEDEIFSACVLDEVFIKRINYLKAGTVTSVSNHIWQYSTPLDVDNFNNSLDNARQHLNTSNGILHELVEYITLAFPYKPDEVYQMELSGLLHIFSLAERKLLKLGVIDKPFVAHVVEENKQEQPGPPVVKQDPKEVWERIHGIKPPAEETVEEDEQERLSTAMKYSQMPVAEELSHPFKKGEERDLLARAQGKQAWRSKLASIRKQQAPQRKSVLPPPEELPPEILNDPKVSPIIKYGGAQGPKVDFAADELGILRTMKGHELVDLDVERELMVREAQKLYGPVLDYLEKQRAKHQQKK